MQARVIVRLPVAGLGESLDGYYWRAKIAGFSPPDGADHALEKAVRGRLYKLIGYEPHYDDTPLRILLVHHNKEVLQAPLPRARPALSTRAPPRPRPLPSVP